MTYSRLDPYGEFFLKQSRPEVSIKGCVMFCIAMDEAKSSRKALRITEMKQSFPLLIHAGKSIFREIDKTEKVSHT
jgi:hypothetical protein